VHLPAPVAMHYALARAGAPSAPRGVRISSYVLMAGALLLFLWQGLLPGVLFACLGFSLTRWLAGRLARVPRDPRPGPPLPRWTQIAAATLVVVAPLALVMLGLSHSRGYVSDAPQQYRELLDYLGRTVLELRLKLP